MRFALFIFILLGAFLASCDPVSKPGDDPGQESSEEFPGDGETDNMFDQTPNLVPDEFGPPPDDLQNDLQKSLERNGTGLSEDQKFRERVEYFKDLLSNDKYFSITVNATKTTKIFQDRKYALIYRDKVYSDGLDRLFWYAKKALQCRNDWNPDYKTCRPEVVELLHSYENWELQMELEKKSGKYETIMKRMDIMKTALLELHPELEIRISQYTPRG